LLLVAGTVKKFAFQILDRIENSRPVIWTNGIYLWRAVSSQRRVMTLWDPSTILHYYA